MKILVNGNIRDCSQDVGETMIAAGLARAITLRDETSVHPRHSLNWHVIEGEFSEGAFEPPVLVYRCSTCAKMEYQYPRTGPDVKFRVPCGLAKRGEVYVCDWHECPPQVVEQYLRAFEKWKNGQDLSSAAYKEKVNSMIRKDPRLAYLRAGGAVTI